MIASERITLVESLEGTLRKIKYIREVQCKECLGKRVVSINEATECRKCYGTGDCPDIVGEVCKSCYGTGKASVECKECKGDGV